MKFVDKLIDFIAKYTGDGAMNDNTLSMMIIGAVGVLALLFIIFVIAAVMGGGKFLSVAKKAAKKLNADDKEGFKAAMKKLPKAQLTAWDSYRKNRLGAPSAAFPADTCLNASYKSSVISAATTLMFVATFVAAVVVAILCSIGYGMILGAHAITAIGLVAAAGGLFTFIIHIIAKAKFTACANTYAAFCALIDAKYTKAPRQSAVETREESEEVEVQIEVEPVVMNYSQPYVEDASAQEDRQKEERLEAEIAETERKQQEIEEQVRQQEERMRAYEEARARAAQRQQVATEEPVVVVAEPVTPPPAPEAPKPEEMDIVDRIDIMLEEGASPVQIKEVARLLQIERAKPENRTPEQTRRLNDALAKLVKAMSSAPRK